MSDILTHGLMNSLTETSMSDNLTHGLMNLLTETSMSDNLTHGLMNSLTETQQNNFYYPRSNKYGGVRDFVAHICARTHIHMYIPAVV